jgi:hypothetical protein
LTDVSSYRIAGVIDIGTAMVGPLRPVAALGALSLMLSLTACSAFNAPSEGNGHLEVTHLAPADMAHFTRPPTSLKARILVRSNGCVNVLIDGVDHVAIWPDDTEVFDSEDRPGNYTVRLSTDLTLTGDADSGSDFEATGVIDDSGEPFHDGQDPPGLVHQLVGFCDAPGAPVLFSDADTFRAL